MPHGFKLQQQGPTHRSRDLKSTTTTTCAKRKENQTRRSVKSIENNSNRKVLLIYLSAIIKLCFQTQEVKPSFVIPTFQHMIILMIEAMMMTTIVVDRDLLTRFSVGFCCTTYVKDTFCVGHAFPIGNGSGHVSHLSMPDSCAVVCCACGL